ncbi:aminotransferase class IV [Mucisphaera sp.]|uniref:aminotransferase class IV n=1 Tax=Mucisphaera sp. TaxID=2913024 RepID=UPI003D0D0B26
MVQEALTLDTEPTVYLNGRYLPRQEAQLPLEERSTLFGEGVYEVVRVYNGHPFALDEHLERMHNSLRGIGIADDKSHAECAKLREVSQELLKVHDLTEALIYWQITRGISQPRSFLFKQDDQVTVFAMAYPVGAIDPAAAPPTTTAMVTTDERWANCWIKSTMLLPNNLAYNRAREAGYGAAIMHREGVITEATSANLFIVKDGVLYTHPDNGRILNGITRQVLIDLARELGIEVHESEYRLADLAGADEAFLAGTTTHVTPILQIDGRDVGSGTIGEVSLRLHEALMARIAQTCGMEAPVCTVDTPG